MFRKLVYLLINFFAFIRREKKQKYNGPPVMLPAYIPTRPGHYKPMCRPTYALAANVSINWKNFEPQKCSTPVVLQQHEFFKGETPRSRLGRRLYQHELKPRYLLAEFCLGLQQLLQDLTVNTVLMQKRRKRMLERYQNERGSYSRSAWNSILRALQLRSLLFINGQAVDIKNMTTNLGILPIQLGPAKLQRSEHIFVHYFNLIPLYDEVEKLDNQYHFLLASVKNISKFSRDFQNHANILSFTRNAVIDEINYISMHSSKTRSKRGLIDGLGTIVKTITGNLDAKDGEKINTILNHLQANQNILKNQLEMGYSVNTQLIKNFNDTLKNIKHNENTLTSRIMQLQAVMADEIDHQNILFTKDLYIQLIILYNAILNILQNIKNTISFCNLNKFHPDIISSRDLLLELEKISSHYNQQLPYKVAAENILNYESILKVSCVIEPSKIAYFLSIPINYEKDFELYYLQSIPTKYESEFVTIIPEVKFLLKSKSENNVWPLSQMCVHSKVYYQCSNQLIKTENSTCESNLVKNQNNENCQYTKVNIHQNHLEILPLINQYLAVFTSPEELQLQCQGETETRRLAGIYLIKQGNCKVIFRSREIIYQDETFGSPVLISNPKLKITKTTFTKFNVDLKHLSLRETPMVQQIHLSTSTPSIFIPDLWTTLLYVSICIGVAYIIWKKKKTSKKPLRPNPSVSLHLPGEASF